MAQLYYADQEARRQAEDVDHDDVNQLHGEGYGVQVHPKRNDPLTVDKESPVDVSAGYGDLEMKREDAGKASSASGYENLDQAKEEDAAKASPPSGYGKLEAKQEDAGKSLPTSGYGGQLNQVTKSKDEGYTSLGIDQESQDDSNSENSLGVPSEEGNNMKDKEGIAPYEPMAKKLEEHSATEGGIIDVHSLKKDYVDLSDEGNLIRERQGTAPNRSLGNLEEQEEREGGPHESSMAKELEGINDVQSLKEDYVDLSEGNTNELDPIKASHADTSQFTSQIKAPIDDPKQMHSVDDPMQEFTIDDSSKQDDCIDATKQESPIDNAKQDLAKACPNDDDIHGCESFGGDDGKEKIKLEGYNIYSGEPENMVYDAAEVLGDQHEKPPHENEADGVIKPYEDLSAQSPEAMQDVSHSDIMEGNQARDFDSKEHDEPFTDHVSSAVEQDTGFKVDSKDGKENAIEREKGENGPANEVSPYCTESGRTDSSAVEKDGGFKMDREEDVKGRENIENVPAKVESPYTEFNRSDDYVKAGYGAEGFVPKRNEDVDRELRDTTEKVAQEEERRPMDEHVKVGYGAEGFVTKRNEDVDKELREPTEKVAQEEERRPYTESNRSDDYVKAGYGAEEFVPKRNEDVDKELRESTEKVAQEEERRPTDEHPLDKLYPAELDKEVTSSGDAYGTKVEGNVKGIAQGKDDDDHINSKKSDDSDVPKRPPSMPHPRPEDLAEDAFNNKNNSNGDDDGLQNHEVPLKKGVFEKIKEKLTPHFTSS